MKYTSFEKKPLAFYRRASGRLIDRLLGITSRKCGHYEWQVWLVRYGFAWGKSCQGDLRVKEQEGNRGGHCAMVRIHMPHHGLTHTHTHTHDICDWSYYRTTVSVECANFSMVHSLKAMRKRTTSHPHQARTPSDTDPVSDIRMCSGRRRNWAYASSKSTQKINTLGKQELMI